MGRYLTVTAPGMALESFRLTTALLDRLALCVAMSYGQRVGGILTACYASFPTPSTVLMSSLYRLRVLMMASRLALFWPQKTFALADELKSLGGCNVALPARHDRHTFR